MTSLRESDGADLPRYARIAGVAMLLSIIFGALGEAYIPGRIIVSRDASATAANIIAHPVLFRVGFATYLVEGICDVALSVIFYVLLRPVNRNLALISAFFGIASMITFASAESAYYSASLVVRDTAGMGAFTAEQRNAMALLALRISTTIAGLFLALYGIATMIRGYLIMRSGYIPAVFGVLFLIGGAGFFLRTATFLLAPAYSKDYLLFPMAIAGIPFMLWLLIRGGRIGMSRA
jgi:RsiW-degrading membrane proteinase PrsW (M82 family)